MIRRFHYKVQQKTLLAGRYSWRRTGRARMKVRREHFIGEKFKIII